MAIYWMDEDSVDDPSGVAVAVGDAAEMSDPDKIDIHDLLLGHIENRHTGSWIIAVAIVRLIKNYIGVKIQGFRKRKPLDIGDDDGLVLENLRGYSAEINKLSLMPMIEWSSERIKILKDFQFEICQEIIGKYDVSGMDTLVDVHAILLAFIAQSTGRRVAWLKSKELIEMVVSYWWCLIDNEDNPNRGEYLRLIQKMNGTSFNGWEKEFIEGLAAIGLKIPVGLLGNYSVGTVILEGFGTFLSRYFATNFDSISIDHKRLMIHGWKRAMLRKKDNYGIISLIETPAGGGILVDTIIACLDRILSCRFKLQISREDIIFMDMAIPCYQEITDFPIIDFIESYVGKEAPRDAAALRARKRKLIALQEAISMNCHSPFPNTTLDSGNLSAYVQNISLDQEDGTLILPRSFDAIVGCKYNVGYIEMVSEYLRMGALNLNRDNHAGSPHFYIVLGVAFKRIADRRHKNQYNDSVVRGILSDFYQKLSSIKEERRKEMRTDDLGRGLDFIAGLELVKAYVEKEDKRHLNVNDMHNLNTGWVLMNFYSKIIDLDSKSIPPLYTSYLGCTLSDTEPPIATPPDARASSLTGTLFESFQEQCRGGVIQLREGRFKNDGSVEHVFLGKTQDLAVYDRYATKRIKTVKEHLPKDFLFPLLNTLGEIGACNVMIGGLACMLRHNIEFIGLDDRRRILCNGFIHSFAPGIEPADIAAMHIARLDPGLEEDIVTYKRTVRANGRALLVGSSYVYTSCLHRDSNFQDQIDEAFGRLRGNKGREAIRKFCDIDIFFAEKLLIFGLAVFIRGFVENIKINNRSGLYYSLCKGNDWLRVTDAIRSTKIFDGSNLSTYWNLLSVIVHGWDNRKGTFMNVGNMDMLMPIIRWEILTLFFRLTIRDTDPNYGTINTEIEEKDTDVPFTLLSNLEMIDHLLDRLHRITLSPQ
jgi:hypothetical protein